MKRSNRLILLIGIFLAIVAFVGIVLVLQGQGAGTANTPPAELPTVYAKVDIPFGMQVTADQVEARVKPVDQRAPDAFSDVGLVIGRTVTTNVLAGKQLQESDFALSRTGQAPITGNIEQGLRAVAIQVDQVSGVGTLINVGDRVDLIAGFSGPDKFPVITIDPQTQQITPVQGLNSTSVKVLLQNLQVVGALFPPPPAEQGQAQGQAQPGASAAPTTALTGQQELVIVAVTPQQAEVIKFAQLDGTITLALRSPKDFKDANGNPVVPPTDKTTGIVLKTLVDQYGVLPPEVIEAVLPKGVKP
ncbi:MAG: Flp pilus assembly protein CpaB [Chloroflexota bacterium]